MCYCISYQVLVFNSLRFTRLWNLQNRLWILRYIGDGCGEIAGGMPAVWLVEWATLFSGCYCLVPHFFNGSQ